MGGALGTKLLENKYFRYDRGDPVAEAVARLLWECYSKPDVAPKAELDPKASLSYVADLLRLTDDRRLNREMYERMRPNVAPMAQEIMEALEVKTLDFVGVFGDAKSAEDAKNAPPQSPTGLQPGEFVLIEGLRSKQKLNGKFGWVVGSKTSVSDTEHYLVDVKNGMKSSRIKIESSYLRRASELFLWLRITRARSAKADKVAFSNILFSNEKEKTVLPSACVKVGRDAHLKGIRKMKICDMKFSLWKGTNVLIKFPPWHTGLRKYRIHTSKKKTGKDPVAWELFALHPTNGFWEKIDARSGLGEMEMPHARNKPGMECELGIKDLATRLGLVGGEHFQNTLRGGLWMPAQLPSLKRQESFEMVKLGRQKSINERAGAEVAIAAFRRPFTELRDDQKVGLFLCNSPSEISQSEMYLQTALPDQMFTFPAYVISLIIEYADFRIATLNVARRGAALWALAMKTAEAIANAQKTGGSKTKGEEFLPGDTVEIQNLKRRVEYNGWQGIVSTVIQSTKKIIVSIPGKNRTLSINMGKGNLRKIADATGVKEIKDSGSLLEIGVRDRLSPAFGSSGNKEGKDIDDVILGGSFLELQIVLHALELHYEKVTGRPFQQPEVMWIKPGKKGGAKSSGANNSGTQGYTGNQGEEKQIGTIIENKIKEAKAQDASTQLLVGALSVIIADLVTKDRLSGSHESLIKASVINALLGNFLRDSIALMSERKKLYMEIVTLMEVLASGSSKTMEALLGNPSNKAFVDLVPTLKILEKQTKIMMGTSDVKKDDSSKSKTSGEVADDAEFAGRFNRVLNIVNLKIRNMLKGDKKIDGDSKKGEDPSTDDIDQLFIDTSVGMVDIVDDKALKHRFHSELSKSLSAKLVTRLTREVGGMMSGLPPGIFLRVDEKRMDVMRAMIIGPQGSPYTNGVFFFDIMIPPSYPAVPPKCLIITTGNGTFRFNANLYTGGKVCLSILGTWSGPGWEPRYSTLTQVLLSIQAMILGVEDPIANEPGWESDVGTKRSTDYNGILKHGTMRYAMLEYLKKPPPKGFEDLVQAHFWSKKEELQRQIPVWEKEAIAAGPSGAGPYDCENEISQKVEETVKELTKLLKDVKPPKIESMDEDDDEEESDQDDF